MGTGAQASLEQKPIFPWAQGMYKPRGHKVYYYPDYPEHARRITHAEVASNVEAYKLALALNAKTRDMCREFEENPSITTQQLQSEFANLQRQIDAKSKAYVSQVIKAADDFDGLIPLLDRMQAMLSQRGKLRELMDTAKLPTWTEWFEEFRPRLKEKMTIRTIQRKLREYRGEVKKPDPKGSLHIDRRFLKEMQNILGNASGLAMCVIEAAKPVPEPTHDPKSKNWQAMAEHVVKHWIPLYDEIDRRKRDHGLRIAIGEILLVGKKKYRVAEKLSKDGIKPTKTKGKYRVSLTVREVVASVKAR